MSIFHINIHFDRIVLNNDNYIALISSHCFCRWQLDFEVPEKSHSRVWNLHPSHGPISKQFSRCFLNRCKTRIENFVIKSIWKFWDIQSWTPLFVFHQKKALKTLWKMFFSSPKNSFRSRDIQTFIIFPLLV